VSDTKLPPPLLREKVDPHEGRGPLPALLLVLFGVMLTWGVFYELRDARDLGVGGDQRSALDPKPHSLSGEAIYQARCASCHQPTGAGVPGTFPPLAKSQWVTGDGETTARILLFGVEGPLSVAGATYNGQMTRFADVLRDEELAAVASYVRSAWSNGATPVDAATVATLRGRAHENAWHEAELLELRAKK
jgi:mono/diheme cytochrome c family protein